MVLEVYHYEVGLRLHGLRYSVRIVIDPCKESESSKETVSKLVLADLTSILPTFSRYVQKSCN